MDQWTEKKPSKPLLACLFGLPLVACLLFSYVTPIGEGPDEPAHLYHVDAVLRLGALDARSELHTSTSPWVYELHQPPLYYVMAAGLARATAAELRYPFVPNPAYPESRKGGAFLPPPPGPQVDAATRGIRGLRWMGLLFCAATVFFAFQVARMEAAPDPHLAICAAAPFVLAPQLAFLGGLVTNDVLTFGLCAAGLWAQREVHRGRAGLSLCLAAGLLAAAAPWAKASGFVLLPTLLLAAARLLPRKTWPSLAALLLPVLISWPVCWLHQLPAQEWLHESTSALKLGLAANPQLLLDYPFWPVQLWLSYWAKLTWFQLRLPAPLYLFYVPPSLLVLGGFFSAWAERRRWLSSPAVFWTVALVANFASYLVFVIFIDFQHQGRLLHPTLVAAVGLATLQLRNLAGRLPSLPRLAWISVAVYFLLELAAAWVIVADEGWP